MASRMDRYDKHENRSKKNEHLYEQINELGNYSNIEGVADISNSSEININMVKKMLESRENYHRTKKYHDLEPKDKDEVIEDTDEKNYDIRDILDKAKVDHSDSDIKYRNLKNSKYDILKNIKINENDSEKFKTLADPDGFKDLTSDDLGMFDTLKSDTMVGDAASIKKILDEVKEKEEEPPIVEEVTTNNLENIDRTFYTSSFSFSDKDFEDLRNLDSNLKKNNKLIKILIIIFAILVAAVIIFALIKFIF